MRFQSFEQFLNEGILDKTKEILKKIGDYFKGVGSKFLNAIIFQKERKLPKGVTIYPTTGDLKLLRDNGITIAAPKLPVMKESLLSDLSFKSLNETQIQTKYPDMGKVVDVDSKEMESYIRDCVEGGPNVKPLLIWGAPGIGKTAIINAVAQEYFGSGAKEERRMIDFDLMTMSPEDFFMPSIVNKDTPEAKGVRLPDEWLPVRRIDDEATEDVINGPDGKGGILFFDEIARCNTKVQNVCLKLIDERKLGNYILGKKWVIIAAANRKSDLSDDEQEAFHWSSTLANRFQQINFASKFADWSPWASSATTDLGELIIRPEILAFLRFNEKYFHFLDPEEFSNSTGGSESWPSPRTWTNASHAILAREKRYERADWKDKDGKRISQDRWADEQEKILSANVGSEAAKAFIGFKRLMEKINPDDVKFVFTNAEKAPKWKGLPIDQINALISAASFQKRNAEKLTDAEVENFTKWLILSKDAPNSIKAINMMKDVVPHFKDNPYWQEDGMNAFTDAYPNIFDKEKV